jgi:hypothetical protein
MTYLNADSSEDTKENENLTQDSRQRNETKSRMLPVGGADKYPIPTVGCKFPCPY